MKIQSTVVLGAAMLAFLLVPGARAAIVSFNVALSGLESVPSNASTAFGSAVVTVDDVLNTVFVSMSFSGLTGGNASAAHIHCCVAIDANGPVVIPFTAFPATTSGTYTNTFSGVSVANIAGIEAGLAYINIHNAVFPGGEIRGDILPAPEPGTIGLMALGLGAMGVLARRVRRNSPRTRT